MELAEGDLPPESSSWTGYSDPDTIWEQRDTDDVGPPTVDMAEASNMIDYQNVPKEVLQMMDLTSAVHDPRYT